MSGSAFKTLAAAKSSRHVRTADRSIAFGRFNCSRGSRQNVKRHHPQNTAPFVRQCKILIVMTHTDKRRTSQPTPVTNALTPKARLVSDDETSSPLQARRALLVGDGKSSTVMNFQKTVIS